MLKLCGVWDISSHNNFVQHTVYLSNGAIVIIVWKDYHYCP